MVKDKSWNNTEDYYECIYNQNTGKHVFSALKYIHTYVTSTSLLLEPNHFNLEQFHHHAVQYPFYSEIILILDELTMTNLIDSPGLV